MRLREADVDARKHGEDKGLDESHQELQAVEEDGQQHTHHTHHAVAGAGHRGGGDEDHAQHADQYNQYTSHKWWK